MSKNKKIGLIALLTLVAVTVFVGVKLTEPSYSLTLDVNPSIEIVSNRLDRVVQVNPLNDDAKEMLSDFTIKGRNLESTIEDLADLMVLKGYIAGGKDNLVMITVNDDQVSGKVLNKLNAAIAAYLENKQIEAIIVNQSIPDDLSSRKSSREIVSGRINELFDDLDDDALENMTLMELIAFAKSKNVNPEDLFTNLVENINVNRIAVVEAKDSQQGGTTKTLISEAQAKEIALNKVGGGKIVEFKLDDDDGRPEYKIEIIDGAYEYELEIDGYSGRVVEFEKDDRDDDDEKAKATSKSAPKSTTKTNDLIGEAKAKEIALNKVGGGMIVEFKLDDDDQTVYKIEIIAGAYEYELEIDGYTGRVVEFEKDDRDD